MQPRRTSLTRQKDAIDVEFREVRPSRLVPALVAVLRLPARAWRLLPEHARRPVAAWLGLSLAASALMLALDPARTGVDIGAHLICWGLAATFLLPAALNR